MHEKLLLYRVQGRPIMSLFLELILAGNGAFLSDRSLNKIAILSKQHYFKIVVDEIMTGGRTGSLLLLTTKSINFISCVSHVTLGKWCQCGIILVSSKKIL
jgi:adenosylmethionine-8-amino-7-oxononanoate aminotransferase